MKELIHKIKVYFLRKELQRCGRFWIGGYNNEMVRITGKRYLRDWEVDQVHTWKQSGKIIEDGVDLVQSTATGRIYTSKMYSWKK
jgi:hypothetical protein